MAERITQNGPDDLISLAEATALLGISERTLYRWEKRGLIQPLRTPGGHRRFRRGEVENLLRPAAAS